MSYFGQKKKQKRINVFLAASLSLVAILLFLALLIPETAFSVWVDGCRFQIYLFTIVVMIYALFCRKTMFAVMALCLLLFNYTIISSSTNLFFNVLVKGEETMRLQYHQGKTGFPDIVSAIGAPTKRMGTVRLAPGREVIFVTFRKIAAAVRLSMPTLTACCRRKSPPYTTIWPNLSLARMNR